jgi:hypothetical protein
MAVITTSVVTIISYVSGGVALGTSSNGTWLTVFAAVLTLAAGAITGVYASLRPVDRVHTRSTPVLLVLRHRSARNEYFSNRCTRSPPPPPPVLPSALAKLKYFNFDAVTQQHADALKSWSKLCVTVWGREGDRVSARATIYHHLAPCVQRLEVPTCANAA